MPGSRGPSHIAMSVPPETLGDDHRAALSGFYGTIFQWREIESHRARTTTTEMAAVAEHPSDVMTPAHGVRRDTLHPRRQRARH